MKKLLLLSAILFSAIVFAQVPQGISYQAIALNGSGNPVVSSNVGVRLSVLDNAANGTVLYTETHTKTTNAQGLFNLVIGQGTASAGTFAGINWGTNSKFLKVEMDAAGGTNYALIGSTQLLSVPYAMYAGNTASISGGGASINDDIIENKSANFAFVDYSANKVYAYSTTTGTWTTQSFNANSSPDLISSNGNFAFSDYSDNKVYTYNGKTATWTSQSFNANSSPDLAFSNGNIIFMDYSDNKVYAYNTKTGTWSSQAFDANSSPDLVTSNNNVAFLDYTLNKVFAYNGKTGIWSSQAFNANSSPNLVPSNGNFVYADYSDNKVVIYNGKTGTWSSQAFNANSSPDVIASETN